MKSIRLMTLAVAGMIIALPACKSKKQATIDPPKGEVEIKMPCSEKTADAEHFRAFSFGESMDANVAKRKALSNAKADLAGQISTIMKVVGDNYVKSSEYNNKEELLERFEENARTVINQQLNGIRPICEKLTQVTSTGKYKYYISLELSGDDLVKNYYESLSRDESLRIDYNYERFKQTFEEEMKKMEGR